MTCILQNRRQRTSKHSKRLPCSWDPDPYHTVHLHTDGNHDSSMTSSRVPEADGLLHLRCQTLADRDTQRADRMDIMVTVEDRILSLLPTHYKGFPDGF